MTGVSVEGSRRILLVGPASPMEIEQECRTYSGNGFIVVVNTWCISECEQAAARRVIGTFPSTEAVAFDPFDPAHFVDVFLSKNIGFDSVVVPYPCECLTRAALLRIDQVNHTLKHPLSIVAVPNDSARHVGGIGGTQSKIVCVKSSGIHRHAVAEYVLAQLVMHSRSLNAPMADTIDPWRAGHISAVNSTHQLRGKTLGVLGASGLDGSAVMALALAFGMNVVCNRPRSNDDARKLGQLGAIVANHFIDVFRESDHLAIHLRVSESDGHVTHGMVGASEIACLHHGAIVVNTAGADLFDKVALFCELGAIPERRRISRLIVDMPFVEQDGRVNWNSEDNCRLRSYEHVVVTPRISGYTIESRLSACRQVAVEVTSILNGKHE